MINILFCRIIYLGCSFHWRREISLLPTTCLPVCPEVKVHHPGCFPAGVTHGRSGLLKRREKSVLITLNICMDIKILQNPLENVTNRDRFLLAFLKCSLKFLYAVSLMASPGFKAILGYHLTVVVVLPSHHCSCI